MGGDCTVCGRPFIQVYAGFGFRPNISWDPLCVDCFDWGTWTVLKLCWHTNSSCLSPGASRFQHVAVPNIGEDAQPA